MDATLRYDHYKILGIRRTAGPEQIKQAFRKRVMWCHPDRHPGPDAVVIFHAVHEAYVVLSDPDRKREYDERLRYYRPTEQGTHRHGPSQTRNSRRDRTIRTDEAEKMDRPVHRFAYVGLHMTGLLFGSSLIVSLLTGISINYMPAWTLVFALPGVLAIPASLAGLRS